MQNKRILLMALVAGLVATALLWTYLSSREQALLELSEPARVVVAAKDVPRGGVLVDDMVHVVDVPRKYVQPGALTDATQVIGRRLAIGIKAEAQLLGAHLAGSSEPSLSFLVPPMKRAVTVAVDDVTGVAGLLEPGDAVDVTAVFEVGASGGKDGQAFARTVLQDVKVLAVGADVGMSPVQPDGLGPEGDGDSRESQVRKVENVTLLVDSRQAQVLVLSQQVGTITLVLRSDGDTSRLDLQPTTTPEVTGVSAPTQKPAKPAWFDKRNP